MTSASQLQNAWPLGETQYNKVRPFENKYMDLAQKNASSFDKKKRTLYIVSGHKSCLTNVGYILYKVLSDLRK